MSTVQQLTVARLNGTARRLTIAKADTDAAVAELQAISTSPTLLGTAAGAFMAGHRHDPHINPFDRRAADLLLAAGGDLQVAEVEAAAVTRVLRPRTHFSP